MLHHSYKVKIKERHYSLFTHLIVHLVEMSQEESTTQPKTDSDLKKIAVDLYEGKIFTDRHIQGSEIQMVFMPIALGAFQNVSEEELKDLGLIYEYLDQAGPRSINNMPCLKD